MANFGVPELLELSKEILDKGIYLKFPIKGESMFPSLLEGDMIKVKKVDIAEIKPGDLVVARHSMKPITHRVIKKRLENDRWIFTTMGDANLDFDDRVYFDDILGKIVSIERDGKEIEIKGGAGILKRILYIKFLLFKRWVYLSLKKIKNILIHRLLGVILHRFQSFRIYGYLAKKIVPKENINCRIATPDDALSLTRLFRLGCWPTSFKKTKEFYYNYLKELENSGFCVLAEIKNKSAGTMSLRILEDRDGFVIFMENIYVHWCYRGTEISKKMIVFAEKEFTQNYNFSDICELKFDRSFSSPWVTLILTTLYNNFSKEAQKILNTVRVETFIKSFKERIQNKQKFGENIICSFNLKTGTFSITSKKL